MIGFSLESGDGCAIVLSISDRSEEYQLRTRRQ